MGWDWLSKDVSSLFWVGVLTPSTNFGQIIFSSLELDPNGQVLSEMLRVTIYGKLTFGQLQLSSLNVSKTPITHVTC